MASPFPGMDPWLEHPGLWPDVHNSLIAALRDDIAPRIQPHFVARLEERTYADEPDAMVLVGRPDLSVARDRPVSEPASRYGSGRTLAVEVPTPDEIHETWLEIRTPGKEGKIITVIEVLSPTNKRAGSRGRRLYEKKRNRTLQSRAHLVEIDLLRAGSPMPLFGVDHASDYKILVSRSETRPRAELLVFSIRDRIPSFALPLLPGSNEPRVELGRVFRRLCKRACYRLLVDYRIPPIPALTAGDARWCSARVRRARSA